MRKSFGRLAAIAAAILVSSACLLAPTPGSARVVIGVGIGPYWGGPGPYPYGYPYVYAPPPVVVAPAYVTPAYVAPAAPTVVSPQAASWYYCDNPKGYYPYVATCAAGWRQVPAQPH